MGLSAFFTSPLALVHLTCADGKPKPDDEAVEVVKRAIDLGCSHVDSADVYGPRTNERMLAKVMGDAAYRKKCLLTTKYGAYAHEEARSVIGVCR